MLGAGLALEYVRDSPYTTQQYLVFEDVADNLPLYCATVLAATASLEKALDAVAAAHDELRLALGGAATKSTRALFTNALPSLAPLDASIQAMGDDLSRLSDKNKKLVFGLRNNFRPFLEALKEQAPALVSKSRRLEMESKRSVYEKLLSGIYQQNAQLGEAKEAAIRKARIDYEVSRFDIVASVNRLESNKKLLLTRALLALHSELEGNSAAAVAIAGIESSTLPPTPLPPTSSSGDWLVRDAQLLSAQQWQDRAEALWEGMRFRLQSELRDEMPPPNSPLMAACPVQPRAHRWAKYRQLTCSIGTEVLSAGSRQAKFEERRHASTRDGILKQGWLMPCRGMLRLGPPVRRWHRLHNTTLYMTSATGTDLSALCDIRGAQVSAIPSSKLLFGFKLVFPSGVAGRALEFQAENEDEQVAWLSALRRCSRVGAQDDDEGRVDDELAAFVRDNQCCADCGQENPAWVSVNLLVTVCEDCALIHQQLGWCVSKLKHLVRDDFPAWLVQLLREHGGNERGNSLWGNSVPEGWSKITPTSSPEKRRNWINAKYLWHAFVDDEPRGLDFDKLAQLVESGSATVASCHLFLTRKVDVNKKKEEGSSSSSSSSSPQSMLQIALAQGNTSVACFLLCAGSEYSDSDLVQLAGLLGVPVSEFSTILCLV